MMIEDKLSEDIHFNIIPAENDETAWHVRLLEEFPETVIQFGNIEINGKTDMLNFSMDIISSPDPDLTLDDLTFQKNCARILSEVLEIADTTGAALLQDKETGEIAVREDEIEDFEEYINEFGQDSSQHT